MEIALAVLAVAFVALVVRDLVSLARNRSAPSGFGAKKLLIDVQLDAIKSELQRVTSAVDRADAGLTAQMRSMGEQTAALTATTGSLREVLSSSRARGQWGERMAEDILRLVGFVEGVNYHKQTAIPGSGARPDFVFPLPGGLRMNMDVKFPLDNYVRALEATTSSDTDGFVKAFLRDVRDRIKEVATREYIDPEGGTVDYVLLFIPNESVYAFIHEHDQGMLDMGLRSRVVFCSPLTLFAVLAVVRQAADNFALREASDEIISLMGRFDMEWAKYSEALEALGRKLSSVQKTYQEIVGPRKRQLERPLARIEALREQRNLPPADDNPQVPSIDGFDDLSLAWARPGTGEQRDPREGD